MKSVGSILIALGAAVGVVAQDWASCPNGTVPFDQSCRNATDVQLKAKAFLLQNAPSWDLENKATLFDRGIADATISLAVQARGEFPWGNTPEEIWLDYVLPYAAANEARVDWRTHFHRKITDSKALDGVVATQAALATVNNLIWTHFSATGSSIYFKSSQTPRIFDPFSVITYGYASCTGVSIVLVDALRAVGIAARLVGTPAWLGNVTNGNHNWVEVFVDGVWRFLEGSPAGKGDLSKPCTKWFCSRERFGHGAPQNKTRVYAAKWSRGPTHYHMAWDLDNTLVPGEDRTAYYQAVCSQC